MAEIKYKTWLDEIEKVEVERSTNKTVWIKNGSGTRQWRKNGDSLKFFNTFVEAKGYLIYKYEKVIAQLENQLNHKRHRLEKIKGMKDE